MCSFKAKWETDIKDNYAAICWVSRRQRLGLHSSAAFENTNRLFSYLQISNIKIEIELKIFALLCFLFGFLSVALADLGPSMFTTADLKLSFLKLPVTVVWETATSFKQTIFKMQKALKLVLFLISRKNPPLRTEFSCFQLHTEPHAVLLYHPSLQ